MSHPYLLTLPFSDILDFAEIEADKVKLETRNFDVVTLLEHSIPDLATTSCQADSNPAETRRQEMSNGCKARILVADDNLISRELTLSMLRRMGLHADAVADGAKAVKILETQTYDLVLMDVQMPVMDGLEAALLIRRPGSPAGNQCVPIIATTAHVGPADREKFLKAEMNDCVAKPISPEALTRLLNKWLPKAGGHNGGGPDSAGNGAPRPFTGDVPIVMSGGSSGLGCDLQLPADGVGSKAVVFDREGLAGRLKDDASVMGLVSVAFLQDIPLQIAALRESLNARDGPRAHRQAHTIGGASANIGGELLREVAFKIEHAAAAGDLDAAQCHLPELEAQFEALRLAMVTNPSTTPSALNQPDRIQP